MSPPRIAPGVLSAEQLAAARSQGALSLFPDPDPKSAEPPRPHAGAGCWVGIDPGMFGYIAAILPSGRVTFSRVPTRVVGEGERVYDLAGMARAVFALPAVDLVVIEKQQAYPDPPGCSRCSCVPCRSRVNRGRGGQGTVSAFTTGRGYGLWEMALTAADVRWQEIGAQAWKKAMRVLPEGAPRRKKGERPPAPESADERRKRLDARRKEAKALAVERARGLFPGVRLIPPGGRVESPDLAEALLLAALARAMSGRS